MVRILKEFLRLPGWEMERKEPGWRLWRVSRRERMGPEPRERIVEVNRKNLQVGGGWNSYPLLVAGKMVQPLWKDCWRKSKANVQVPCDPIIPPLGTYPGEQSVIGNQRTHPFI